MWKKSQGFEFFADVPRARFEKIWKLVDRRGLVHIQFGGSEYINPRERDRLVLDRDSLSLHSTQSVQGACRRIDGRKVTTENVVIPSEASGYKWKIGGREGRADGQSRN